jgi:hypothetical protein
MLCVLTPFLLPAEERPVVPDMVIHASGALSYATVHSGGLYVSENQGLSWQARFDGLPGKIVYPFTSAEPRRINSLSYDPTNPSRIGVVTAYGVYVSGDLGKHWDEVPIAAPIKTADHITAIAISPHSDSTIFIGTSFNGYFVSRDGGITWRAGAKRIQQIYRGAGFYEEIAAITVSPDLEDRVFLAAGFDGGLFESADGGVSWISLELPALHDLGNIAALSHVAQGDERWALRIHGETGEAWVYGSDGAWEKSQDARPDARGQERLDRTDATRRRSALDRTGIYVNSAWAYGSRLTGHLDLVREHGMDTIVVDMKDDAGRITYDTELQVVSDIGARNQRFTLGELLTTAHKAGVYVVGRIVVFQDPKLYRYDRSSQAIWNSREGKAWGNLIRVAGGDGQAEYEQREFWVDPYSQFVWEYNIAIAEELQQRGVDEIQFDYIRFPSDGDLARASYRHQRPGMSKVDAIESFLRYARTKISIPISTDLYGYNSWYRMGNWIGQNLDVVADYVDAVSPMFYPSHFPAAFMGELDFLDRAQQIYEVGSDRAAQIVDGRCIVRPYVQAFLIGRERAFEEPEFASYLARQLEGVVGSAASGFTLWNASNIYYMVTEPLVRFSKGSE